MLADANTAVLNLTINNSDTSFSNIIACDSLVWNGNTYIQSGTYYYNGLSNVNNVYSVNFDGVDDYIEATNISLVDEVTWGCHINPSSFAGGSGNVNHILGKYAPTAREFVLELDYGEVKINIFDQNLSQWHTASSGNSINLNEWVSIVATYNKNSNPSLKLYLDGVLVGTDNSYHNSINTTNQPIRISNSLYPFDGMIDNVFIFDRELDIYEIQQRTNCPLVGNESGLVGYWNFELPSQAYSNALGGVNVSLDASGPNCQQQIGGFMCSGNGNNGIINGATYTTNVPSQSCNLTNVNGCDSVAVLNLTINQSDTSYTNITHVIV